MASLLLAGKNHGGNRKEQIEALEVLLEFNERLVKNMKIIVKDYPASVWMIPINF